MSEPCNPKFSSAGHGKLQELQAPMSGTTSRSGGTTNLTTGDASLAMDPKVTIEWRSSLPVPTQRTLTAGTKSPPCTTEQSKGTVKKKQRRRRLSEILRSEGHQIKETVSTEDDALESAHSGRETQDFSVTKRQPLTKSHYSWNRYILPNIYTVKSRDRQSISRSSLYMSDTSVQTPEIKPRCPTTTLSPIVRFRQAIHKVMTQIFWSKKFQGIEQHQKTTYLGPGDKKGERELLTFNVKSYRSDVQYESLSLRAKTILSLPSWLRTDEEVQYLHRYCIRLNCFSRYSAFVRKELARVLYYEKIEKDHFVIRQGRLGWFFYFIVSGSVLVEMQDLCLRSGKKVTMIAGEVKAGGVFGDLALMHRCVRRASIITNEDCEFLKVDKSSFDEVLRKSHETEWKNRLRHLTTHPLFQQWKDANLNTAVEGSQTREYMPGSVILKDLSVPFESIYFIIQGCCQVVQKVKLWEKLQNYHDDNIMFHNVQYSNRNSARSNTPTSRRNSLRHCKLVGNRVYRLVTKWWIIRTLKEGEYFGLGEGEDTMSIVCDQKVVVLLMSKNVFRKHDRGRDLAYLRTEAITWYPGHEAALVSYLEYKRWHQYRRNLVLEVLGCRSRRESTENYVLAE